jgi:hypothetical protein
MERHHWLGGATKSLASRDSLCKDVIQQLDFDKQDLNGIELCKVDDELVEAAKTRNTLCPPSEV